MTPHPDAVRTFRGLLNAFAIVAPFWAALLIWSLT